MNQIILLELNELNFESIKKYVEIGKLKNFGKLMDLFGYSETLSEDNYTELEPWIQWVTAHTGMSLEEHKIFRLGDIVNHDIDQIWEKLERKGISVGAVSPMNAKNRTKNACFFIPDPWTKTSITGGKVTSKLYDAISQAVNDNAQNRVSFKTLFWLLCGLLKNARVSNYGKYVKYFLSAKKKTWSKALFLDLLLSDTFFKSFKQTAPQFSSLFLNAGAHIQHHYMFSSEVYNGELRNPSWYIDSEFDPVLEVYQLYDEIIGSYLDRFPGVRVLIATGLHQDPHPNLTYYWRLKNHEDFLNNIGIDFLCVKPRMSRDFLVEFSSVKQAESAEELLDSVADHRGEKVFEVDNRGTDLFITLTYSNNIDDDFVLKYSTKEYVRFKDDVAFVAIKNGQHNGVGYFMDTGVNKNSHPNEFPLSKTPEIIYGALGVVE